MSHPGQLSATDHGHDWGTAHAAYRVTPNPRPLTHRDLHGYA
jgi:hypothetical protein